MYQVIYTGRLLKGADRAMVESELQRLFKATPRQVEWFLRGKPIVVKSCDDATQAGRYFDALVKAGLECELRSDQPASAPMTPPAEESAVSQAQLPIPGVSTAPKPPAPRPATKRRTATPKPAVATHEAAQRRAPMLGPVTQAITAQDSAPAFSATAASVLAPPVPTGAAVQASQRLLTGIGLLFLVIGAVLVGTLAYFVRQEWLLRRTVAPVTQAGQSAGDQPVSQPEPATTVPLTPEVLIVGRWQCVEAGSGRVIENEFTHDGQYRSLAHGRPDAFQQIEQMDILVEGRYRLDGNKVVLHVQNIPSRGAFGDSTRVDNYLYWRIDSLTRDAMVWADTQLEEITESCLRSQALSPKSS